MVDLNIGNDTYNVTVDDVSYTLSVTTNAVSGALNDITDVVITSPSNGESLQYNGTNWVNATGSGTGDMTKVVYDSNDDGVVDAADTAAALTGAQADAIVANTAKISYTDAAKVAGIEAGATADQTGAEIKALYEAEANTNAFTDAEKTLLGNQSGVNTGDQDLSSYAQYVATTSIVPDTDLAYDLGSSTKRWNDLYLSGSTLVLGDASISATGSAVNLPANSNVGGNALVDTTDSRLSDSRDPNPHTQAASTITDFDTEVSNNTDVAANTSARHSAVTLSGTPDYITLSGQDIVRGQVNLTTDVTGVLPIADGGTGSSTAAAARTALDVDQAGTDNSTDVTLAGALDYITLSGQEITRNAIDLTTDVSGFLPVGNIVTSTGASSTTFLRGDGSWSTPVGSGDVSKDGTPVNNEIGVWTGDGTIEGDTNLQWTGSALNVGSPSVTTGTLNVQDNSALTAMFTNTTGGANGGAGMIGYTNDGAATANNERLGFFLLGGASDASNTLENTTGIIGYSTENWSGSAHGSELRVGVTANGATSRTEVATFDSTGLDITGNITVSGTVDGIDIATDVAANTAKVTCNTANVTSAGALMDSEVTNLAQVKAFDSADYASASHTHTASDVTDFDTEVSNNASVTANTAKISYTDAAAVAANTAKVSADGSIATHSDVTLTALGVDELLFTQDGSTWVNQTLSEAGIQPVPSEGAFVDGDKTKLDGIETGAEVNAVDSVNTATGAVVLDADDIDDTSTTHKFATSAQLSKVDHLSVTQAVNLDTMETNSHASGSDTSLGSGCVAADHGTASTDQVVNVCYGTSATPPTASTTTEGALYIQYTA